MPDYSACMQTRCERRGRGARYLMKSSSRWQTVASPDPGACTIFWNAGAGAPFELHTPEEADAKHTETLARWRQEGP